MEQIAYITRYKCDTFILLKILHQTHIDSDNNKCRPNRPCIRLCILRVFEHPEHPKQIEHLRLLDIPRNSYCNCCWRHLTVIYVFKTTKSLLLF